MITGNNELIWTELTVTNFVTNKRDTDVHRDHSEDGCKGGTGLSIIRGEVGGNV